MGTTAEKLAYLDATKTAIKDAIVAKGVEIPDETRFRGYAEKIEEIKTGGGEFDFFVSGVFMPVVINGHVITTANSSYVEHTGPAYKIPILNDFSYDGQSYTATIVYDSSNLDLAHATGNITELVSGTVRCVGFNPNPGEEFTINFTLA